MRICVLGLGYVGAVSSACFSREGHEVIGVDPDKSKVDLINAGKSPTGEKDVGSIMERQVAEGRLGNRDCILNHIPHISCLMVSSIDEVADHSGTIVIGNAATEFGDVPGRLGKGQSIIDPVRATDSRSVTGICEGICW